jgi:hypothetical protein
MQNVGSKCRERATAAGDAISFVSGLKLEDFRLCLKSRFSIGKTALPPVVRMGFALPLAVVFFVAAMPHAPNARGSGRAQPS